MSTPGTGAGGPGSPGGAPAAAGGAGEGTAGPATRLVLVTREGCHLCDTAREVLARTAEELGVAWAERDVTADPEDVRHYLDLVPVVLLDGELHDYWRVDEARLRAALAGAA